MKYGFLPKLMWSVYKGSFKKQLKETLAIENGNEIMKRAKKKYKEILSKIPIFDKQDRFIINILSCSMLSSILLSLDKHYSAFEIENYYENAMCKNRLTRIAVKSSHSFSKKGRKKLKEQAKRSERNTNPYSWKFRVEDGSTLQQYTAYFTTCGICHLMTELELKEYVPALCHLDYSMAKLNHTIFKREQTLAQGGIYCDCHYDHQE